MLNYEFFITMSIYEARILFIQTLSKYISATFNLGNKTAQTFAHIFLWTAHCGSAKDNERDNSWGYIIWETTIWKIGE